MLDALPPACLDRHLAILGTSDAGKTYAAKGEVERLLAEGRRVCVIDPTGVWWGLRLQADGETPSPFRLPIFGGLGPKDRAPPHADVPVSADAGDRLAELIVEGEFSCILDVSLMSVGARTRLFTDLAEGLMANTRPLHLVIDEAHLFAPQGRVNDPQSGAMVGAANSLVSGGRARGLRVMLLSQRPAKLHKDSLTQVQTLVAMLNISPQDRKAVGEWIADSADKARGAEILASLPSLPTGAGWVWAPRLDVLEKVAFRRIATFDSSRTPEAGDAAGAVRLGELDLEQLREAFAAPPPAAAGHPASAKVTEAARSAAYEQGVAEGRRLEREEAAARPLAADPRIKALISGAEHVGATQAAKAILAAADAAAQQVLTALPRAIAPPTTPDPDATAPAPAARDVRPRSARTRRAAAPAPADDLSPAAQDLIIAARQAPVPVTWAEAAVLAGKVPQGGHFEGARKQLRDSGHGEPWPNDLVGEPDAPRFGQVIDSLAPGFAGGRLGSAGAERGFRHIAEHGPISKAGLAAALGLQARGGHWEALWKRLRRSPLLAEAADGSLDLVPILRTLQRERA